jgi:hypothetical protein
VEIADQMIIQKLKHKMEQHHGVVVCYYSVVDYIYVLVYLYAVHAVGMLTTIAKNAIRSLQLKEQCFE